MLDQAQAYELQMSSLMVDARRLFPMEIKGFPAATQRMIQRFRTEPAEALIEAKVRNSR